ncbi:hypothetical protein [Pyxidicoccus trucidator]|uniref:hypothetical protein n=1 Tax=Pyxidicoccus trucidator TaxID=2709662 RepID=UPI001967B715|nr:hypothetical protein [Pyxidicoccus trucidator]
MFLVVLLGACQQRGTVPERLDGLYFADRGVFDTNSAPKLLLLEQGLFELLQGTELSLRGTFEARDGLLRLKPVGGGTATTLETTYAVVDGRLLLGVLRQVGDARHRWTSAALPSKLLGHERMVPTQPEAFRIDWDLREGEWRFTSGARQVVLNGVARLEHPKLGGRLFVPVFRSPAQRGGGDDPARMLVDHQRVVGHALGTQSLFGLEPASAAPLVWDGAQVRSRNGGAGSGMKPAELVLRILSESAGTSYERRGEVVVTPWTVDLGPVGLLPVRADPSKLAGTYVNGDKEFIVSAQPPSPSPQAEMYAMIGQYHPEREVTCHYAPDARGLVTWTLGGDHMMGHWDKATRMFCFVLADGRVVRYRSSGGCGGMAPPALDVFERRTSPRKEEGRPP